MTLLKDSYREVSGYEFYDSYMKKYDEANQMISMIKSNKDNIPEQMRIIGFNQVAEYEHHITITEEILQKIRNESINGKVNP